MLQRLYIRNYAIIDELDIAFAQGLNIITGETGAGKSILMGALGLVLGQRADTAVLFEPGQKCIVEATFATSHPQLSAVLQQLEIEEEPTVLLRREIAPSGKSRSFVNDTPVTLQDLRQVASLLVDLHRQFDTQQLADDRFQFEVLDALAGNAALLQLYQQLYSTYQQGRQQLQAMEQQQATAAQAQDYTRFLYQELEALQLQPGEGEQLEAEARLLADAESIQHTLAQATYALEEQEPSVLQQLKQLAQWLGGMQGALPEAGELHQRLQSAHIELADIAREVGRLQDRVTLDPERLVVVNDRLSALYKLQKKHQVHTGDELLALQAQLESQLQGLENMDTTLEQLRTTLAAQEKEALQLAGKLSAARQKQLPGLEKQTAQYLQQMGMPNARLKATVAPAAQGAAALHRLGIDAVAFLFDANKTGRFEPIEKVASGGELSRLMLAIKAQVAQKMMLPALIFDEIDTGISGEAARQVGLLMKSLALNHQVIAITHQPQIAARAQQHLFVYKAQKNGTVKTGMRLLEGSDRAKAIALMLGGEPISDTTLRAAQEMLEREA